jgi:hypothetical protein
MSAHIIIVRSHANRTRWRKVVVEGVQRREGERERGEWGRCEMCK